LSFPFPSSIFIEHDREVLFFATSFSGRVILAKGLYGYTFPSLTSPIYLLFKFGPPRIDSFLVPAQHSFGLLQPVPPGSLSLDPAAIDESKRFEGLWSSPSSLFFSSPRYRSSERF